MKIVGSDHKKVRKRRKTSDSERGRRRHEHARRRKQLPIGVELLFIYRYTVLFDFILGVAGWAFTDHAPRRASDRTNRTTAERSRAHRADGSGRETCAIRLDAARCLGESCLGLQQGLHARQVNPTYCTIVAVV